MGLRQVVACGEGLLDGLAGSAHRQAVDGAWSHLISGAERGEQIGRNVRNPKKLAVVFPIRRHKRMSIFAEVADMGVVEECGTDYVRLAERPALTYLG